MSDQTRLLDQSSIKKALLENPTAFINKFAKEKGNSVDIGKLTRIADDLQSFIDQHASLIKSRKSVSRLIGNTRKKGGHTQALILRSNELSKQINHAASEIDLLVAEVMRVYMNTSSASGKTSSGHHIENQGNSDTKGPGQFLPVSQKAAGGSADVIISNTTDIESWNSYVATSAHATHYHQYQWRGIIDRNFAQKTWYVMAKNVQGEITGIAASAHMNSRIFGNFMLSMPFLIYGGPIANDQKIGDALAAHLSKVADQLNCTHTELRETNSRDDWHGSLDKVSMVLELPDSLELLSESLGAKLRSQIKRAGKERPGFRLGGAELIPEFYSVFSRKMRDLGTPVYAVDFFQDIARTFPESTYVAVVRLNGKPVAAAFLISYRDTLEIPWAASCRKYDRLSMNMFMYHALLEEAVKREFRYFDFGRSTRGESTWSFKKQWGAQERQLHWNFLSKGVPYDPGKGGASVKFAVAIGIWKKLPLWITNQIGPMIAKHLPW